MPGQRKKLSRDQQNEDWKALCEGSLIKNHLPSLEKVYQHDFKSNDTEFLNSYLRPFVILLDSIRSAIEHHYSQLDNDQADLAWLARFETLVSTIIQPTILKLSLHKGDFYVHLSSTLPRKLQLKFYDSGTTQSRTLSTDDCIYMCSEDWADSLRKEAKSRFVFSNCIVWSSRGLERKPWRSIFSQHSRPGELSTQISIQRDSVSFDMEERDKLLTELEEKPLHILELDFEIIHSQIAYLPGARDKRGGAVIVVRSYGSCWDNFDVSSTELAKLFLYYYQIPRLSVQKLGCSLVVDARQGKQVQYVLECIGEAITLFQDKVPNVVHMAYVITRTDSLLLMIGAGRIRDKLNFQFQMISNLQKLYQDISQDQLPVEFGGTLLYNHEKWIKFRTHLEPFMISCRSAAKHAMASIKELAEIKLGDSVAECEALLGQHRKVISSVLDDSRLTNLKEEGKKILERLSQPTDDIPMTMDYSDTKECVQNLYLQMDNLFDKFQKISSRKSQKLETQLKIFSFDENSEKILNWIDREGMPFLQSHIDIGDSIGHVTSLQADFLNFETSAEETLSETKKMIEAGEDIVNLKDFNEREMSWLKERVEKLASAQTEFTSKLEDRRKQLSQGIEFYRLFEKASDWSLQSLRYIAQMNMEDLQTLQGVQKLKEELETFLKDNSLFGEKEMARMTELAHHLESERLKMQAGQISTRCSEVEEMIKKKFKTVESAEARLQNSLNCASSESSSGIGKDEDLATECGEDVKEQDDSVGPMFSWKSDSERGYDENDELLAAYDAQISSKLKEKLCYIAEEMINTENDYVASLEYILKNYIPELEKPSLPPTLVGKKNILFGNIERIHDFHKRYFSQELENYLHTPLQVGKCFLRWERQFYIYALYNKNKPKSDQLLDDFGNSYFAAKQNELKDKLNLASYLIKPVQRLGKYALLLKDMANCCSANDPRMSELLAAQDMIKFQLRHGNDLLAMDSIRECDVNLRAQGCLLRQGEFVVYSNKKKHARRVFLFEEFILFSKAKKQAVQGDCFVYKNSLKITDVGLTENIGEKGLRFEVWYRRWRKSKKTESYILQASSCEIKDAWVSDIRKLLLNDLKRSKDYSRSEATTGISVESQPSGLYSENSSSVYPATTQVFSRARTDSQPKIDAQPFNQNKRLSWVSSGSANTSGIHDMSAEIDANRNDPVPNKNAVKSSNSFTLPRKPPSQWTKDGVDMEGSKTAYALVDMPFRNTRSGESEYDASFVRNTIKRRTLHVEFPIDVIVKETTSRTVSSPIATDRKSEVSSPKMLDEVDEETEIASSIDGDVFEAPSGSRGKSASVTQLPPLSHSSPKEMLQKSTPCLTASTPPSSRNSGGKFTFPAKKHSESSKEKTKEKQKKQGRRISLGGLIGKKKKTSSAGSEKDK
ncbi:puratrophin-1-like isoform X2 [Rhopilema esculentum]|uniref:puratrophin-1-like isoform X2 n=1 Tax=Rhopilema esculentum TaxID=499914 RepID=UPI0031D96CBA